MTECPKGAKSPQFHATGLSQRLEIHIRTLFCAPSPSADLALHCIDFPKSEKEGKNDAL